MATAQLNTVIRHIRLLAHAEPEGASADGDLLERFIVCHDEAAFRALVARHGQLVLSVCRHVLNHDADAEDAFQATFLVLAQNAASIRKQEALASWLHGVAYRIAMKAKRDAARRRVRERQAPARPHDKPSSETSLRELQIVLDEEIQRLPDKFQAPFVLCCLEGKSIAEAGEHLGWKTGTVSGRLAEARKLLQRRLARRGLTLSAALCVTALAQDAASAALPAKLVTTTVKAAMHYMLKGTIAGVVSKEVAALVQGVARTMVAAKMKVATVLLVAVGIAGAGAGLLSARQTASTAVADQTNDAARPVDAAAAPGPDKADTLAVRGRVEDRDGKPIPGAKLYLSFYTSKKVEPAARAVTNANGQFGFQFVKTEIDSPGWRDEPWRMSVVVAVADGYAPDWVETEKAEKGVLKLRLPKEEFPIRGQVVDLEGRPVAGVTVRRQRIETTPDEDLGAFVRGWKTSRYAAIHQAARKSLPNLAILGLEEKVQTDRDGKFELRGVGRERLVSLRVEGPTIQAQTIYVVPRSADEVKALMLDRRDRMNAEIDPGPALYPPTFRLVANPTRPIIGKVCDARTGKPLAGVHINGSAERGWWQNHVSTQTDAQGHYQLLGLAKAESYRLTAFASEGNAYLPAGKKVRETQGLEPIAVDFEMARGVRVEGRMIDKATGKPLRGAIWYVPLAGNKSLGTTPGSDFYRFVSASHNADKDGKFNLVVLPGFGAIFGRAGNDDDNRYQQAHIHAEDRGKPYAGKDKGLGEYLFGADGHYETISDKNEYQLIDPPPDAERITCNLELDPGKTRTGTVLGPDGQPLAGATVVGVSEIFPRAIPLPTAAFAIHALDVKRPRTILFFHKERKLARHLDVRGDSSEPLQVRLEPFASLTGRVVDGAGKPIEGASVQLVEMDANGFRISYKDASPFYQSSTKPTTTGSDGKFRLEEVLPGLKCYLFVVKDNRLLHQGRPSDKLAGRPGGTKDIGDIKVRGD
jgi:RNA polymerase sigma factor (sigma-70 family)